jgi:death on curing protein
MTVALAIHSDQIREHGGSLGLREKRLLASALDRPRNRFHYEPDSDLATLAAAYGFASAKNHPFVDGNKRVAFQAMYAFLGINGLTITADEEDVVHLILGLAASELKESELILWLRDNTAPRQ